MHIICVLNVPFGKMCVWTRLQKKKKYQAHTHAEKKQQSHVCSYIRLSLKKRHRSKVTDNQRKFYSIASLHSKVMFFQSRCKPSTSISVPNNAISFVCLFVFIFYVHKRTKSYFTFTTNFQSKLPNFHLLPLRLCVIFDIVVFLYHSYHLYAEHSTLYVLNTANDSRHIHVYVFFLCRLHISYRHWICTYNAYANKIKKESENANVKRVQKKRRRWIQKRRSLLVGFPLPMAQFCCFFFSRMHVFSLNEWLYKMPEATKHSMDLIKNTQGKR